MGKQAKKKKKDSPGEIGQHRHNASTRGVNTTKRGPTWALRKVKGPDGEEERYEVRVPPRVMFNPHDKTRGAYRVEYDGQSAWKVNRAAAEPFDSMSLDWREEIMHYAVDNGGRIGKLPLEDGKFLYRVYSGANIEEPDEVFFEIVSKNKLLLNKSPRRR